MDPRHIHHCHHHTQQQLQQPPPVPPFDRHGGFPQRIFPPFSASSSASSTDGDIRPNKRFPVQRCAWICVAVLCIVTGAVVGVSLGYQFLSLSPAMEQVFRGSFRILEGDKYKQSLRNSTSAEFQAMATKYKGAIDSIYSQSILRNVFLGSEILAFTGPDEGVLTVQFNINVDTHKIRVDAGDLFITLAETIRSAKGILLPLNVTVDQRSMIIQERNMEFFYLPSSTDRMADQTVLDDRQRTVQTNHSLPEQLPTAYPTPPTTTVSPVCDQMEVDFCLDFKSVAFREQKLVSESLLAQMRLVVASRCHPFAAHFLCSWGVACEVSQPCLDYCEEFLSNCAIVLPSELKALLKCDGPSWHGQGSCLPKPGCVEGLYRAGQGQRVCDGIMDCGDFSDEIKCPYCKPGHFHCGSGRNCISPDKKCDGKKDCPNGSDEKACLTLAPSAEAAGYVHQYFNEGFIFVHDQGRLGKLCVERNDTAPAFWRAEPQGLLQNIGSSACELLGFRKVAFVRVQNDLEQTGGSIPPYVRIHDPGSSSEVTFTAGLCPTRKVLYVGCNHLECGQRPAYLEKKSNLVTHGDFPWHAVLLKNEKHVCDATLITSQWLVTTLECFRGSEMKAKWTVHFGRVRMGSTSPWQQERRIIGMVKSPLGDNLVLIKMASPVIFSDFARHICLPEESDGGFSRLPPWGQRPSKICVRLGWNKQEEVIETRMHEVGPELCPPTNSPWFPNITRPPLCLENTLPGKDCLREVRVLPGAPLLCQNEHTKEWVLSGIAPALVHPKCGIERYRVAAVSGSTEWILKTVEVLSHNTT